MENNSIYVLLADDDEDDRLLFVEAFAAIKIKTEVKTVNDGIELINHLSQSLNRLPHILFLDLNMPRKSGLECLMEIKNIEQFKEMAIAIYSTSASDQDIEDAFVKGANIYIKKPSDFVKLKNLLEEVITINWHYQTSGLNRDSFLLSI
jgi:CheY-like chemotaxis protein